MKLSSSSSSLLLLFELCVCKYDITLGLNYLGYSYSLDLEPPQRSVCYRDGGLFGAIRRE